MNSNVLPGAEVSPRVANGCLCWYEGDTFSFALELELTDQDGEAVAIGAEDVVTITFYDAEQEITHEAEFTGIENNTVTVEISETVTKNFPEGDYSYDVRLEHGNRTTLIRRNIVHVE